MPRKKKRVTSGEIQIGQDAPTVTLQDMRLMCIYASCSEGMTMLLARKIAGRPIRQETKELVHRRLLLPRPQRGKPTRYVVASYNLNRMDVWCVNAERRLVAEAAK